MASGLILCFPYAAAFGSTCYGTTAKGKLDGGVKLPNSGNNFESYSLAANLLGRTYVHSKIKDIVTDAYKELEKKLPEKVFKYAETGFKNGGKFYPHKTHQNGLSVDFMVPVVDDDGESVHLPTNVLNKFGYNIEFDNKGKFNGFKIDFESMATHLFYLNHSAIKYNAKIWRVIFDPKLQKHLLMTKYGNYIRKNITLSKNKSWIRHDEHYHVDFSIPCKKYK